MIIKEGPNVTVTYSGYTLDTMFAIGQSLNLRYKTLNKRIKCDYQLNSVCSNLMNLISNGIFGAFYYFRVFFFKKGRKKLDSNSK